VSDVHGMAQARHLKSIATCLWAMAWTWWASLLIGLIATLVVTAQIAAEMRQARSDSMAIQQAVQRALNQP
jgi:hypothetical protein